MKNAKKTLKVILNVIVWLFVFFSVCITILVLSAQSNADGLPEINGKCLINILSDSMSPTFKSGDMIIGEIISDDKKSQLQVNDVITYYTDLNSDGKAELNSHRIIGVNYDETGKTVISYTTKGDNTQTNVAADKEPVLCQKVICKWTGAKLSGIGTVISFLQTSKGFLLCIVLPLLLFFLYELYRFIIAFINLKNNGKKQLTAAEEELIKQRAIEEYLRQKEEAEKAQKGSQKEVPAENVKDISSDVKN